VTSIAFLYIAEAYQCYHGAAIALELAGRPGVWVQSFYNDPDSLPVLERIEGAHQASPGRYQRLRRSAPTRRLQSLRRFGLQKTLTLWDNRAELDRFDAIVAVEDTASLARLVGIRRPKLIYYPHGFGDRERGFSAMTRRFDHVLLPGPKTAERMLRQGLVRADNHSVVGPVKLETSLRLRRAAPPLFASHRSTVLYNAHKAPRLSSWDRFIEPILAQFAGQEDFNLLVAPHIKMFRRRPPMVKAAWEGRGSDRILIDVGSERLLDMSHTLAADIYVGDVSSQVYEFLAVPRPCVFLNAGGHDWRDDPNFAHWHLGDVVDDPGDVLEAVRAAPGRHGLYRARQEALAQASLGPRDPSPSRRAADAILTALAAGAPGRPG
jgi:hypothetical protein